MNKMFSISGQQLVGVLVKYNYHLLFLRSNVSIAGVNSDIFHWKNRQIRLKIDNLGGHGNGQVD